MSIFGIHIENFYFNLFEKRRLPAVYPELYSAFDKAAQSSEAFSQEALDKSVKIHSFPLVPDYWVTKTKEPFVCRKVFQKNGYAANLAAFDSIEAYIKVACKRNFRNNILRSVKRMELCLNVRYHTYYGEIDQATYQWLMHTFHDMLTKRFEQRHDKNPTLLNWEHYMDISYDLINQKKASLFVIFHEEEPIAFALNFKVDHILYFSIPTFNLDYSKFTPGNVVIYKQLEWCFDHQITFFDMGYGGFENKVNWCNTTYQFEHHIVHEPQRNWIGGLYSTFLQNQYRLINYLLAKQVNTTLKNIKLTLKRKKKDPSPDYRISILDQTDVPHVEDLIKIDINEPHHELIRKPIYDFLYLNNAYIGDVSVYKTNNPKPTYIVQGKTNQLKIEITHHLNHATN